MDDRYRKPQKSTKGSVVLKGLVTTFPLVRVLSGEWETK
jgi:hypothetical protein